MSAPARHAGNPLRGLAAYGQSIWLDFIHRRLLTDGSLQRQIRDDNLAGMTSNPAIFEKAITSGDDYRASIATHAGRAGSAEELYERLAIEDIRLAADILRPVHDSTERRDGLVSLEVSPHLAHDTEGTVAAARRLWRMVDRPNLMIKVPATPAGLPAMETLVGEGLNVNVTLLFARDVYEQVARTYVRALERFAAGGGDVSRIAGVASFFISRIDSAVDGIIGERLDGADAATRSELGDLRGRAAVANGKLTYALYKRIFAGDGWRRLAARGARPQRVLWASTSTKDPSYRDVLYVEELIGPDTVNTMPPATMDAFRDHGRLRASLEEDLEAAEAVMRRIEGVGISLGSVTDRLLSDGVQLFAGAYDRLLDAVGRAGGRG